MIDYRVARLFNIPFKIKVTTPTQIVSWKPPTNGAIKLNCDGSSIGTHPCGSIGVVIRDSNANFLGAISSNIGHASPLEVEFSACMLAIEKAQALHLNNICLETDSIGVVKAYNKDVGVPWQMRARWHNCMRFCKSITCSFVHTLREGNMVADALAKNGQGISLYSTQWWPSPPSFIAPLLLRDQLGLPFYRLDMT
jgi:ribonuclease HI